MQEYLEHRARMVGPLTVSLGLGCNSLWRHHNYNARCGPRAQDPVLTLLEESPFGYKASTHIVAGQ